MLPRPRDLWLWALTILDDVLVGKFWYRLKRGEVRGAARSIGELLTGFPGFWLALAALGSFGMVVAWAVQP